MGALIEGLQTLQKIEKRLADVRNRLGTRKRAVDRQQARIDEMQEQVEEVRQRTLSLRKEADSQELTVKQKEEEVNKLRGALNTARSNKEYASILTEINTRKADNQKLEETALKLMEEIEQLQAKSQEMKAQVELETQRLEQLKEKNASEIQRLSKMLDQLQAERDQAAAEIDEKTLAVFDRIASNYDGEAMAPIEVHGRKPPYSYICGGCFMGLTPEHANALATRDEIRTCDNCGRILYVDESSRQATG